jgi:NADPH2:quinone reductase
MKSWWIRLDAAQAEFERRDVPVPRPRAGELLIKVQAASLNRGELVASVNGYARHTASRPAGVEAAGVVAAVGESVVGWSPKDRVMGLVRGGFAEYALLDAREALPVPQRLYATHAATVPLVYGVMHDLLYTRGRLTAKEWLLIAGIAPGVGAAALQVAKLIGARVVATSGSLEKLEKLRELGLDVGIYARTPDFARAVREATRGGANMIINNAGSGALAECMRALAFEGRLANVGQCDGASSSELDLSALHSNRVMLFGASSRFRTAEDRAEAVRNFARDLLPAFNEGRIHPLVDRVFAFNQLPDAKAYLVSSAYGSRIGKVVVHGPD